KAISHNHALPLADFKKGADHVRRRAASLQALMLPASELYTGQQHVRLMRGVQAFVEAHSKTGAASTVDLWVLSAGYGLVPGSCKLAPYSATFKGMPTKTLRAWAAELDVPKTIRRVLRNRYDLGLGLLGDAYLEGCALDSSVNAGGATISFCRGRQAKLLP